MMVATKETKSMKRGLFLLFASLTVNAQSVEDCQSLDDDAARLACYDAALAPREEPSVVAEPEPAPEPAPDPVAQPDAVEAAAPEPAATAAVLTDDIGIESVKDAEKDALAARGRIVKCQKGRSGKYVFWFDNGQVWRQKGSLAPRWRECTFDVTISKDVFGYTMSRDGEDRKYRIDRVK